MIRLRSVLSLTLLTAGVLGMASCDKAKLAVDAAREKFRGATNPGAPVEPGGEVASELVSQVDTAAEGVRFRRDLPFPTNVTSRVTMQCELENIRRSQSSAIGSETGAASAKVEVVALLERHANRVSFAIERAGEIAEKAQDDKEAETAKAKPGELMMPKLDFEQGPQGWRVPSRKGPPDFQNMLREKTMLPAMEDTVAQNGLSPRKQWFSPSRRWAVGDRIVLEGSSLGVLFSPRSSGKVTLVYEVAEPIDGHPCARFSLSGDVDTKGEVSLTGDVADRKLTIKSGKVWCSLLHPLVLRQELDMVLTEVESSGGVKSRMQGAAKTVTTNEWKPVTVTES